MSNAAETGTSFRRVSERPTVLAVPDPQHRWRCGGCGNMTRFDVVREARTREFWHLDPAGAATVDDTDILSERVASVSCRWCGRDDVIEVVARPGAESG